MNYLILNITKKGALLSDSTRRISEGA